MSIVASELCTKLLLLPSRSQVILLLSNGFHSITVAIIISSGLDISQTPMDSTQTLQAFMQTESRLAPQSMQGFRLLVCEDVAHEATRHNRFHATFDSTLIQVGRVGRTKMVLWGMEMSPTVGDGATWTAHNDTIHDNDGDQFAGITVIIHRVHLAQEC